MKKAFSSTFRQIPRRVLGSVFRFGMLLDHLGAIERLSDHTKPDNYVFADRSGLPINSFGKTFKRILDTAGLLKDRHGRARTIYSLRHTYATFRLLYGGANIEDLAQNMGTSPTQIFNHYRHITTRQKAKELVGRYDPAAGNWHRVF